MTGPRSIPSSLRRAASAASDGRWLLTSLTSIPEPATNAAARRGTSRCRRKYASSSRFWKTVIAAARDAAACMRW